MVSNINQTDSIRIQFQSDASTKPILVEASRVEADIYSRKDTSTIFPRHQDFHYFILPMVLGVFTILLFQSDWLNPSQISSFFMLLTVMNGSHVASTYFATRNRIEHNQKEKEFLLYSSAMVTALVVCLAYFFEKFFFVAMAYLSMVHIARQQYGWVMISRAKSNENRRTRWIDSWFIATLVIYPLCHWHSPLSNLPKTYGNPGDMVLTVSLQQIEALSYVYWSVICAFSVFTIYRKIFFNELNRNKLMLLMHTFLFFYLGLVAFNSFYSWWILVSIAHSIPYIGMVWMKTKQKESEQIFVKRASSSHRLFWFLVIIVLGSISYKFSHQYIDRQVPFVGFVALVLLWLPDALHYWLDAFIWKRPKVFAPLAKI